MRDFVNQKTKDLQPSGIRKFFDILSATEDAISLGVGEPDFLTSPKARSAAIDSVRRGRTQYTGNRGMPVLLELISRYLETRFALRYDPLRILVTVGGSEGIDLAMRACIENGDEVLIPEPAYVAYTPLARMSNGVPVQVECREEDGFVLKPRYLERAITSKTKAIVLNYPNNPTGGIMSEEDLRAIAKVIEKHDLLVITDEVYAELTYGRKHVSIANIPEMQKRTVYVGGFSKAFAMTGWRIGYVCAPKGIIEGMLKIHQYAIMCAATPSQFAAIEALKEGFTDGFARVEQMRAAYDERRKFALRSLRELGLSCFEPRGAFYAFPSVRSTGLTGEEFANGLLKREKVAVVPGRAFGNFGEYNVRLSYATGVNALREAMERTSKFLAQIQK